MGDPHVHTGVSQDGGSSDLGDCGLLPCGDFYTVFTDARANGLDWIGVSDHVNGVPRPTADTDEFNLLISMALEAHDPDGGFVTLPSAEVWAEDDTLGRISHFTMAFWGDNEALADLEMTDFQPVGSSSMRVDDCAAIWTWMEGLKETFGDVTLIPHHPAATRPMATNWNCFNPSWEPAVEIYSEHGLSLTEDDPYDVMWSGVRPWGTVHHALDPEGLALQMGFMAGSDSHDTRPGQICQTDHMILSHPYGGGHTIAVLPRDETFDRDTLHEALYARHTYATTGPHVPVVAEFRSGGALLGWMGDDLGVPAGQPLDIEVRISEDYVDALTEVSAVHMDDAWDLTVDENDGAVWNLSLGAEEIPSWIYVVLTFDGNLIYGEDGCDDGGDDAVEKVWLSPNWTSEVDPDLDLDGESWADGDCDDGDATISSEADEIWYDGIDQDCDGDDDDQDHDGYAYDADCDDLDPGSNPGATERWYDGTDQDCDGNDDDQDEDGYPLGSDCDDEDDARNPGSAEVWYDGVDQDCDSNDDDQDDDGYILDDDCDDLDPSINPGAAEVWYDGTDQDCDGNDRDQDQDGFHYGVDCDDTDPDVNTGSDEIWYDGTDQDCDGNDQDQDRDGYILADDCVDTDAAINPGSDEIWYDGIDQDCDGNDQDQDRDGYDLAEDCDDDDASVNPDIDEVWYDGLDQDCDGNDDDQDWDGFVFGADCDDTAPGSNPDAAELWYDGIDQNCDGNDDDQDWDGFPLATDCDDTDASVNPDIDELWYDGIDQDCDGNDDDQDWDGFPLATDCDDTDASVNPDIDELWYDGTDQDCDGNDDDQDWDGYALATDCDDTDAGLNPGADELWYDGIDQDCDGNDDDQDQDSYALDQDCDDTDPASNPGSEEIWYDGTDQDCDGRDDDQDQDGYALAEDCDDQDPGAHPGAAEIWYDGLDQNCDGRDVAPTMGTGIDYVEPGSRQDTARADDSGQDSAEPNSADADQPEIINKGGCASGCSASGHGTRPGALALLLALALLRRRADPGRQIG